MSANINETVFIVHTCPLLTVLQNLRNASFKSKGSTKGSLSDATEPRSSNLDLQLSFLDCILLKVIGTVDWPQSVIPTYQQSPGLDYRFKV